jgi:hypothetical protein
MDPLKAPLAPATPLSRSSCLAPQLARPPASPKVTMSRPPLRWWGMTPTHLERGEGNTRGKRCEQGRRSLIYISICCDKTYNDHERNSPSWAGRPAQKEVTHGSPHARTHLRRHRVWCVDRPRRRAPIWYRRAFLPHASGEPASFPTGVNNVGSSSNGMKLVVTSYHIKGYGGACRMHPRAVEMGSCSIPRPDATVSGSDQRPELMPRDP